MIEVADGPGIEMHDPVVYTDGGPWAEHDMACAVCQDYKAVLDIGTARFHPCWVCQRKGWQLTNRRRRWWRR